MNAAQFWGRAALLGLMSIQTSAAMIPLTAERMVRTRIYRSGQLNTEELRQSATMDPFHENISSSGQMSLAVARQDSEISAAGITASGFVGARGWQFPTESWGGEGQSQLVATFELTAPMTFSGSLSRGNLQTSFYDLSVELTGTGGTSFNFDRSVRPTDESQSWSNVLVPAGNYELVLATIAYHPIGDWTQLMQGTYSISLTPEPATGVVMGTLLALVVGRRRS